MKKTSLLIVFILSITVPTLAQPYDSLVKPVKKWYYKRYFPGDPVTPAGSISILKKTLKTGGITYNQLIGNNISGCWIREDSKKVYMINLNDLTFKGREMLMYDFNLEKGDTFRFKTPYDRKIYVDSFLTARIIVDSTFTKDNRKHIVFKPELYYENNYTNHPPLHQIRTWVEGLGTEDVLLHYAFDRHHFELFELAYKVTCFFDNGSQVVPASGNCDSLAGFASISKSQIKIYPNPASSNFNLQFPTTEKYKITIYNSLGQKSDELDLEGKTTYLLQINYGKGIYLIRSTNGSEQSFVSKLIVE